MKKKISGLAGKLLLHYSGEPQKGEINLTDALEDQYFSCLRKNMVNLKLLIHLLSTKR